MPSKLAQALRIALDNDANLSGANLRYANLYGANLGDWERGPDGYAVKKTNSGTLPTA